VAVFQTDLHFVAQTEFAQQGGRNTDGLSIADFYRLCFHDRNLLPDGHCNEPYQACQ
jgi:hypothetical protein